MNISGTARPVALVSAAGVALATIAASVANAVPAVPQSKSQNADLNTTAVAIDDMATVEVPDVEWTAEEDVTASAIAEAPAPTPAAATPAADQSDSATSRSEIHSGMTSGTSARQAALNATGGDVVLVTLDLTDIPYVYGGRTLGSLDCSGLVKYAHATADVNPPHSSSAQAAGGTIVPDPRPGDIVSYPSHVAIYIDDGQVVKAMVPGCPSQASPIHPDAIYMHY